MKKLLYLHNVYYIPKLKVMYVSVDLKQLKFQFINEDFICVTFRPINSKLSTKKYFCMIKRGSKYYDLAYKVSCNKCNWVEVNYLAQFVSEYDEQIISSI